MDKHDIYLAETNSKLALQLSRIESVRQRGSGVIGVGLTLVAFAGFSGGDWPLAALLFGLAMLVWWLASMILSMGLLRTRTFLSGPNPEQIKGKLDDLNDGQIAVWAADMGSTAFQHNEPIIAADLRTLDRAVLFLILEAIGVVGVVVSNRVDTSAFKFW